MSDYAVEIRTRATRARSLGDATPIYRAGESRAAKAAGEKTNGEIDKTMTQRLADLRDAALMTTRCGIDDCDWSHTGPAGASRTVALDHRKTAHPGIEKGVRRCVTPGCTGRAVKGLDYCGGCAKTVRRERATTSAMRARGLNRDGTPLLEEATPARDVGVASSSSQLDDLAEAEPGDNGETSASTTTREDVMECKIDGCDGDATDAPRAGPTARLCVTHRIARGAEISAARKKTVRVVKTVEGIPPKVATPAPDGGTLATLASELEQARDDLNRATGRYEAAVAAFKQHDVVKGIANQEGIAA